MSLHNSYFKKDVSFVNSYIDKNSYDLIYRLHNSKLIFIALQYLPSKQDAEGVVQEVFLKLWEKKEYLKIDSNITGYLYKMTRNACLDILKKKRKVIPIESYILHKENILKYNALANNAASGIIEKELEDLIQKSVEQLPEKCKKVFIKSRFQGLKHKEISHDMNISTKTVENHISKALKHLRFSLREYLTFF